MNEKRIRDAVHSRLIRYHNQNSTSLVVDELGLHHGESRIDIAVINGSLHGYEIKSEDDDLSRLPSQVKAYSKVFDKVTLIVATKHLDGAKTLVPGWWGIVVVDEGPRGGVRLTKLRNPITNSSIDEFSVAMLLWKREAIELLQSLGYEGGVARRNREEIYNLLIGELEKDELLRSVRNSLKARKGWRDPQ